MRVFGKFVIQIALPALLPTLLFSIGEGAIIPIIPLVASNLGASLAIAGLVAALLLIGELIGNIPSGWLVARIGERPAMIGAAGAARLAAGERAGLTLNARPDWALEEASLGAAGPAR